MLPLNFYKQSTSKVFSNKEKITDEPRRNEKKIKKIVQAMDISYLISFLILLVYLKNFWSINVHTHLEFYSIFIS